MSAFLGPIHYWLFKKIRFEQDLGNELAALAIEKQYAPEALAQLDHICGSVEEGELEDLIDGGNIHGWLQERLNIVEERLAYIVTAVLAEDVSRMEEIREAAYRFGLRHKFAGESPQEAYGYFDSLMLNGMPCDRVLQAEEREEGIQVRQVTDIHEKYWTKYMGDVKYYYLIRQSVAKAMFADTAVEFLPAEGERSFALRRRA